MKDAHTKLSCKVPMSGCSGNLLTRFRGEQADLQIHNDRSVCIARKQEATYRKQKPAYLYTFHFPVCNFSGRTTL